ncbi:CBS domain-containing protein [Halobellus ordinarius]|uniref:CBS domain-containing protein n=1 Tax=Halobellus ordinarius TaxID=3075120 RepID=UPI00287FFAD9|nr:CBS domain-containing protein [Halobellus sp. ZY16]
MDDIFVARVMSSPVHTVSPDTLVEDAAEKMLNAEIGSVVVVDDGQLVGILTNTDFVQIVAERKPKDRTPVSAYMSDTAVTTTAQVPITQVAESMIEHGIHHVPVVDEDDGAVIGIVTTTDLTSYVSDLRAVSA